MGYAKVRWKQQTAHVRRRQKTPDIVTYCSNQQYLATRRYVVGEESGDSFDLPPGKYLYRFQIQLPDDLPSSFEGQYGHIRYEVIVRIDRPFKFDNIFKLPFTVITPLNLNLDPSYKVQYKTLSTGLVSLSVSAYHGASTNSFRQEPTSVYPTCFCLTQLKDALYDGVVAIRGILFDLQIVYNTILLSEERCIQKTFWCGLCGSNTLTAKVNLPMRGYAPGQDLHFILGMDNAASISITDIIVTLEKNACYTSHYPATAMRYDNIKIFEKNMGPMRRSHQKEFRDYITLPAIPPTMETACKVIQITYQLIFDIRISGCHRNAELSVPITVGTIPIIDANTGVIQTQPSAPKLPLDDREGGSRFNWPFDNVPPPSYEEAVRTGTRFVDEEEDRHSIHKTFMPKYPVYYNCKTPSP